MDARPPSLTCACGRAVELPAGAKDVRCPGCGKTLSKPSSTVRRAAPSQDVPPSPIPGYVFQKRIGQGGMGEVFLAKQVSLDRLVAVKLLPPDLAQDRAYVENFVKEARSAGKLNHENITGAVDVGEAGGRYYFVMEYVAGDTLWNVVRKQGPLPEAKALDVARQVAKGLRHAQQNGFIHRDIKPKNLLLTAEGGVKICDFGLARALKADVDSEEGVLHVTPAYASPEQCKADPALDHRTDIYSLGITLFETLTGKRPFGGQTSKEIMRKHLSEEAPSPASIAPSVSPGACALVARMLKKKPDERFKSYDELLAAIDAIGAPAPALRVAGSGAAPAPKKKLALAGAVAGAAALLLVAGLFFFSGGTPPAPAAPAVDPAVEAALREVRAMQAAAEGRPSDYAAVRAKWQELETRFRGSADHPAFSTGLREFESKASAEADRVAAELLADAEAFLRAGKPLEAIHSLRRFPSAFGKLEAGLRVGTKAFEAERALEAKVGADLKAAEELSAAGKYDEARSRLHLLRLAVTVRGEDGNDAPLPAYAGRIDDVRKRVDADQALALKRAKDNEPAPAVVKPVVPTPVTEPTAGVKPPDVAPAPKPKLPAAPPHVLVLRDPAQRTDALKRAEALKAFGTRSSKQAFSRAASIFLERPEEEWKLEGPPGAALAEYLASPALDAPGNLTSEQHASLFALLAQKIADAGGKQVEALQLFACAHVAELAARKERIDPAVALQARFGKGAVSDLWGPSATVGRIEAAGLLAKPPGPWVSKAAEAALAAPDFETRVLGMLFTFKEPALGVAAAADKWKKFGAAAGDAAWQKTCDGVAERIRLPGSCESCSGQGKYPCGACGSAGITACPACRGLGSVPDPCGGKVTCVDCKGRKAAVCAVCAGAKSHKCLACDTKKTRPLLPGAYFRMILDLAGCDDCDGLGTALPGAAWPCAACGGLGRRVADLPAEFAKLPPWTKTREGRTAWNALRWLSRHQAGPGFWSASDPGASCREPGCPPSPGGAFDLGATAYALLAFSAAGFDPLSEVEIGGQAAGSTMRRALAWLLSHQDPDGHFASGQSTIKPVFEHLAALLAAGAVLQTVPAGSAYPERDRTALRDAVLRGVRWALGVQAKGGGWGYTAAAPSDSWVTSWGAHALLTARDAGLEIPKMNLGWIVQWFDATTDKADLHVGYSPSNMGRVNLPGNEAFLHHDTLSAYAGLLRMSIDGKSQGTILAAEKNVERDLPSGDPLRRDFAYWWVGTVFLAQRDQRKGTAWERWSNALAREILALQETADTCALGSLPAVDRWSAHGGKVYAAAAAALALEVAAGVKPPLLPGKR
jgi:serine/threonine-protein kinase